MNCSHYMAPNEEELLAYALDDEPLPEQTRTHLEQCETCQRQLAEYKQINSTLVSRLYRSRCPSGTELNFYCADMLPEIKRISVAAHIRDCPLCTTEIAEIRTLLRDFDPFPQDGRIFSPIAAVRRIFATLVRQQAQLVLRGGGDTAWPRQYRAENIDLSLHLSRASNGQHVLLGIITSADTAESVDVFEGTPAELYSATQTQDKSTSTGRDRQFGVPLASVQIDDLGNFVFNNVPVGEYVLVVHLPERELVIDGLTISYT